MSFSMNAANFLMLSVFLIAALGYLLGRITPERSIPQKNKEK